MTTFINKLLQLGFYLFLIFIGIGLFFTLIFFVTSVKNNLALKNFQNSLRKIELGENTQILDIKTNFGLLYGNGNHCNAEGYVVVKTKSDPKTFYEMVKKSESEVVYPFKQKEMLKESLFVKIFYFQDKNLYLVEKNNILKIEKIPLEYSFVYSIKENIGYDFALENKQYYDLTKLFDEVKKESNYSYFILTFSDYSESIDLRCQ